MSPAREESFDSRAVAYRSNNKTQAQPNIRLQLTAAGAIMAAAAAEAAR